MYIHQCEQFILISPSVKLRLFVDRTAGRRPKFEGSSSKITGSKNFSFDDIVTRPTFVLMNSDKLSINCKGISYGDAKLGYKVQ